MNRTKIRLQLLTRAILIAAIALTLANCGTTPPPEQPRITPEARSILKQADALAQEGKIQDAITKYKSFIEQAPYPEKFDAILKLSNLLVRDFQASEALQILNSVSLPELPSERVNDYLYNKAKVEVELGDYASAMKTVAGIALPDDAEKRHALLTLRIEVLENQKAFLLAAADLVELQALEATPEAKANLNPRIWQAFKNTPLPELNLRMPPPPDAFGAWLELSYLTRTTALDPVELETTIRSWQQRYPDHIANLGWADSLISQYTDALKYPRQIAVLLPLSDKLANAGQAVREGFIAALYNTPLPRPQIRFYDVETSGAQVTDQYLRAINEGADFIVGPLSKENLIQIANFATGEVPVLALNYLPDANTKIDGLFQFGLLPEDEARQMAQVMRSQDNKRVLVLAPANEWGDRIASSFTDAFEALGGDVVERTSYDPNANDFSDPIKALLNIDESEARYRMVRSLFRDRIEFEPKRREDVDAIFAAAYPRQGRLIKPQLRFHQATQLPMYATSHIYAGTANRNSDIDLEGVIFVDMPWQYVSTNETRLALRANRTQQSEASGRLQALGVDSFRVIPYLRLLDATGGQSFAGFTGNLALDDKLRIKRELQVLQFRGGTPHVLEQ